MCKAKQSSTSLALPSGSIMNISQPHTEGCENKYFILLFRFTFILLVMGVLVWFSFSSGVITCLILVCFIFSCCFDIIILVIIVFFSFVLFSLL